MAGSPVAMHARRGLGHRRLEAPAGERALVRAVLAHEHPRAFAAIGAALHAHDRGDGGAPAAGAHLANGAEESFGLAEVHVCSDSIKPREVPVRAATPVLGQLADRHFSRLPPRTAMTGARIIERAWLLVAKARPLLVFGLQPVWIGYVDRHPGPPARLDILGSLHWAPAVRLDASRAPEPIGRDAAHRRVMPEIRRRNPATSPSAPPRPPPTARGTWR